MNRQAKYIFLINYPKVFQEKYAKDFVYTDSLNLNDKNKELLIGVNCRTCDRMDCQQRAFPPLHKKFDIDLNKRGISVYVAD